MSSNPAKGPLIDAEPARRHVRNLMAAGVSVQRIADHAGISFAVVSGLLYTRGPNRGPAQKIRLINAKRIFSVRAENLVTYYVDPTGTRRRLQALMANGWPQLRLGPHIGRHPMYVNQLLAQPRIYGVTAVAVAAAYDRLWNQDPRQHGVRVGTYKKVLGVARAHSWAPPGAWDDDTIDDPAAHPEWTGYCGTDRGWWTHTNDDIPTCARCEAAHAAWLAERRDLPARERWRQLALAKGAASSRGANLAHDARELLSYGVGIEQAAERLGVTRQHLQQELLRHPEQDLAA
ncbi:hypothetical protein ACIGXF_16765 [Streptomyces sp. NPDC053086]|uniref:hypothetical protein n=1 Tax=unclassified Streptomyces TaxID=2593676 RepID=UPI0037D958D9